MLNFQLIFFIDIQLKFSYLFFDVVSARAQKVAEWKDRKEAILRGEITATEGTSDSDIDSIYEVQEEVSSSQYHFHSHLLCVFCDFSMYTVADECRLLNFDISHESYRNKLHYTII